MHFKIILKGISTSDLFSYLVLWKGNHLKKLCHSKFHLMKFHLMKEKGESEKVDLKLNFQKKKSYNQPRQHIKRQRHCQQKSI